MTEKSKDVEPKQQQPDSRTTRPAARFRRWQHPEDYVCKRKAIHAIPFPYNETWRTLCPADFSVYKHMKTGAVVFVFHEEQHTTPDGVVLPSTEYIAPKKLISLFITSGKTPEIKQAFTEFVHTHDPTYSSSTGQPSTTTPRILTATATQSVPHTIVIPSAKVTLLPLRKEKQQQQQKPKSVPAESVWESIKRERGSASKQPLKLFTKVEKMDFGGAYDPKTYECNGNDSAILVAHATSRNVYAFCDADAPVLHEELNAKYKELVSVDRKQQQQQHGEGVLGDDKSSSSSNSSQYTGIGYDV
jgi:hypothetical protein